MKKAKKTHKRMMNGGMAATTKPAFNKGPAISTKPAFDKGPAVSGSGGMNRMADGGMATMDMPMRGSRPVPAGLMKQQRPVNRPVGADNDKRPPRKFILPERPFVPGGQNASGYNSGYSEGPRPRPGGAGVPLGGGGRDDRGPNFGMNPNMGANLRDTIGGVASGLGAVGMKRGGAVKEKKMRGGGLARKGVGMALAKGGLAKRAGGCAKRGVGRGKIV